MDTIYFRINARSNAPITEGWRTELISMMGGKPRRLSTWCELGIFGALSCIRTSAQDSLPSKVPIRVYTESGTITATQLALAQHKDRIPMPFTFIQTQPSQLFNALGGVLSWNGDGATLSSKNLQQYESFALREIQQSSVLAWVEEVPSPISSWIWLEKATRDADKNWQKIPSIFQSTADASGLKIGPDDQIYQAF